MPKKTSRSETAERISVLIRIYRSAMRSGDDALRRVTAAELKEYGLEVSLFDPVDLANAAGQLKAPESKGGVK